MKDSVTLLYALSMASRTSTSNLELASCNLQPVTCNQFPTCNLQPSGMFNTRDSVNGLDKSAPATALGREDFFALRGQLVIAAAALSCFFDPAPLNPAPFFKPVKERIEGGYVEAQGSIRPRFYELPDLVAVPWPRFDQRQHQQLGAALFQFAIHHPCTHIL